MEEFQDCRVCLMSNFAILGSATHGFKPLQSFTEKTISIDCSSEENISENINKLKKNSRRANKQ